MNLKNLILEKEKENKYVSSEDKVNTLIVENNNEKEEFYKYKKTLFGFKKVKVSEEEAFSFKKDSNHFYIPLVTGLSFESYLLKKIDFDSENKRADFGQKIICKLENYEQNLKEENYINERNKSCKVYVGDVSFYIKLYNDKGILISDRFFFSIENYITFVPVCKEFYESIFSATFSGIYKTARMKETYTSILSQTEALFENGKKPSLYYCEECKEKFNSLDEFLCHLIETLHTDSIFMDYPFDEELKRVKTIIENKKKTL